MADASVNQAGGGGDESTETKAVRTMHELTLPHLRRIFEAHAPAPGEPWGKEQIASFLIDIQRHRPEDHGLSGLEGRETLDLADFLAYMASPGASLTTPPRAADLDLSWPLACYFISSSHNTYLSGNQLSSDSTVASYTNVLLRGCRCVEVDVWDGEDPDASSVSTSSDEDARARADPGVGAASTATTAASSGSGATAPESGKKLGRYRSIKGKLPRSLTARLEKTSLGRKLEERELKKEGVSTGANTAGSVDGTEAPVTATDSTSSDPAAVSTVTTLNSDEKQQPALLKQTGSEPEVAASAPSLLTTLVEPRVLHGYTLTKDITFRDVCTAIRASAFTTSDTPLIVSLEVHCSPAQQATMVRIMRDTWGDVLVPEPAGDPEALPSPDALRNKILVKVKYAPPGSSPEQYESSEDDRAVAAANGKKGKGKPSKIIQDLSRMGVYTRGVSFKSFDQPEAAMPTHIFSLAESKFLDHHEKQNEALWEHNKHYLMRAYPSGLRIRSDNLNPAPFWGSGAQVVALNWQQTDEGMMLNEAMFAGTGGYVLKPPGYRPSLKSSPETPKISKKSLTLTITLLAAQGIPIPPNDTHAKSFEPYVKVELHVDALDGLRGGHIANDGHEREGEYKARSRTRRGRDVDFSSEKLVFKNIPGLIDELAFVRFTVRDDEIGRDDLAAWACVRLDRLGEGYRFLQLMDANAKRTDGVLLVKVEKQLT